VTLTSEQRTRVRETVLAGSNVPRVNNVNFALRVGTVVPTTVRVVEVHDALINIHPEWRGHYYFVVNDDIVIVDREHHIVAMVPVGSSSTQLDNRGGASGGASGGAADVAVVDLSPDEIRQVQIVLNQKGFNVGEPDGRWGSRTRQALIMFQQRQGLQATGRIDSRTVMALGVSVSNMSGAQGNQGQPSTTGQGGAQQPSANQPSANQPPANQQQGGQGGNQPPTTGQGGAGQNNQGSSGPTNMDPNNMDRGARQQPNQPSQSGAGSPSAPAQGGQSR
jgi:hypothetical protein